MERDHLNVDQDLIDTALNSVPLEPLPEGFVAATMARITPQPRFHIQFLDVAIPFSIAALVCSFVSAGLWLAGWLNAAWLPPPPVTLPIAEKLPALLSSAPWLGIALLLLGIEGGLALVAGACVSLWIDRPTWRLF
jgi:hypothetical protein